VHARVQNDLPREILQRSPTLSARQALHCSKPLHDVTVASVGNHFFFPFRPAHHHATSEAARLGCAQSAISVRTVVHHPRLSEQDLPAGHQGPRAAFRIQNGRSARRARRSGFARRRSLLVHIHIIHIIPVCTHFGVAAMLTSVLTVGWRRGGEE
ncbi:MAG: hypothetical protein ACO3JL_17490, partial [Myxococcota bacterium]